MTYFRGVLKRFNPPMHLALSIVIQLVLIVRFVQQLVNCVSPFFVLLNKN